MASLPCKTPEAFLAFDSAKFKLLDLLALDLSQPPEKIGVRYRGVT